MGDGRQVVHSFKGLLGQLRCQQNLHCGLVVKFKAIPTTLPELDKEVWSDLSRDQQLLYRNTRAVLTEKWKMI